MIPTTGGIRVSHPSKRNAFEIVVDYTRPLPANQMPCPTCQKIHTHKTYHIYLGDEGTAIVSPGVFRGLQNGGMGDLVVESHVKKPPTQVLGGGGGMMGLVPTRPRIEAYHS